MRANNPPSQIHPDPKTQDAQLRKAPGKRIRYGRRRAGDPCPIALRAVATVVASASIATTSPAGPPGGQASLTCEFALAGWIATEVDLGEARRAYRDCRRARQSACTAEQGRVQALEQQLRLLRNYVDGYCRR
jgi:hypothetical protein